MLAPLANLVLAPPPTAYFNYVIQEIVNNKIIFGVDLISYGRGLPIFRHYAVPFCLSYKHRS